MNTIKYIYIYIFIYITSSCTQSINNDTSNSKSIKISFNKESRFELKDSVECKFIALETTDNSLIGVPRQVKIANNTIFVLDYKTHQLYAFDINGKFISKVGKNGEGANSYIQPISFNINKQNNTIEIIDATLSKLSTYNLNNFNYITSRKLSEPYSSCLPLPNGSIAYRSETGFPKNKPKNHIIVKDSLSNTISTAVSGNFFCGYSIGSQEKMYLYNDELYGYSSYNGLIYKIMPDKSKLQYELSFGDHSFPPLEFLEKESAGNRNFSLSLIRSEYIATYEVFETSRLLAIYYILNSNFYLGFYDKKNNIALNYSYPKFQTGLNITGLNKPLGVWDDYIIFSLNVDAMKHRVRDNFRCPEELERIVKDIDSEANPILFMFKLK